MLNALLASFASPFTQAGRLLTLRLSPSAKLAHNTLLAYRLRGSEHVSACYRFDLDCLTADAQLDTNVLLGLPVQVEIAQPAGAPRSIAGLVTRVEQRGSDGGFARVGLIIEPALAALAHRITSRVFQDKSVPDIVQAIVSEHQRVNPVLSASFALDAQLRSRHAPRSYCLAYRESDQAFIERLLAEEGISYYFRFATPSSGVPQHTMVLFDDAHSLDAAAAPRLRFHRADATEHEDSLTQWESARQIQPSHSSLASFDYKTASVYDAWERSGVAREGSGKGLAASLEHYDPQTLYYATNPDDIARYARLRQQAADLQAHTFRGEGNARGLSAGTWFRLDQHPLHEDEPAEQRAFVVTSLSIEARNNLPGDAAGLLAKLGLTGPGQDKEAAPYVARFSAVRRGVPIVPPYSRTAHAKPTAPGMQTAIVVGPPGEEIHTDELGRIKVQFHWQRTLDHRAGGAQSDANSSTWVRVIQPAAGAQWGHLFLPRVGQEVAVVFAENDIDRPLVIGGMYNGTHPTPTFSGAGDLPANQALSGIKTKELRGTHFNELLFDDTPSQTRVKLSSEHSATQLNLGFLTHPRTNGQAAPRGQGWELRSDAAGALRAARGVLISAWERAQASGHQLGHEELDALKEECFALFVQLGRYAAQHQGVGVDAAPQEAVKDHIKHWEQAGDTRPGVVGITAPAGVSVSTAGAVVTCASQNIDSVALQHVQITSGEQVRVQAGKGIALFAQSEGVSAIAHQGKMRIQSQHDDTEITAHAQLKLTATDGKLIGMSGKSVEFVTAGGAYLKLEGGNIELGCPGSFTVKSASYRFDKAGAGTADLPRFDQADLGRVPQLLKPTDANPVEGVRFKLAKPDGQSVLGTTSAEGKADLVQSDQFGHLHTQFLEAEE